MKILLLDADGVALKNNGYFSDRYSEDYGVSIEEILPFFKKEFRDCQEGKADLKEVLIPYLEKWDWKKSLDDFLEYWFSTDTILNEEVFVFAQQYRDDGIKCYLATDQEKYRAAYLRTELDLNNKLDGCFFSYELGCSKSNPNYFTKVIETLGVSPADITYFDDDMENVTVAQSVGINAHFYSTIDDIKNEVRHYF